MHRYSHGRHVSHRVAGSIIARQHSTTVQCQAEIHHHTIKRPTYDDVQRLSMGKSSKSERGWGSRQVCHRLNQDERKAYDIALQKGYLTLKGTGYRKERKGSPLANIYRQYCDARDTLCVNVLLRQAGQHQQGDVVLIDMTPKRRWVIHNDNIITVDPAIKDAIESEAAGWEASRVEWTRDLTPWTILLPPFLLVDDHDMDDIVEHYSEAPMWQIPPHVLAYSVASRPEAKALAAAISQITNE